jgi:hypothetical protein
MPKKTLRINIPTNVDELLKLIENIIDKHQEDGAESKLNVVDMKRLDDLFQVAVQKNEESIKFRMKAEDATQERNNALGIKVKNAATASGNALYLVTQIRDILLPIYKGNEKKLGEWGFSVDDNPKYKRSDTKKEPPKQ